MTSPILSAALSIKDEIIADKRRLHSYPELGMKERLTTEFVLHRLGELGIPTQPLDPEVGAVGLIRGNGNGPERTIALRADMDALPIQETADVPDKSTISGVMHACGHDCHTAMLLGTAKLLMGRKDQFSGTVKLLFQPAEETLQGSRYLIDHGALENPHVDTIIGLHGTSDFHTGEMAFLEGPAMASSDSFIVTVTGEAGHGAYPHVSGRDPLLAAANCIVALQGLVTRQFNAIDSLVLSVCEIHGGKAPNAIPQAVSFSGTVRTQCEAVRRQVEGRMNTMLADICAGYGCTHTTEYRYGVPPLVNDPEMVASARRAACNLLGADKVKTLPYPSMGSEDFAFYGERVPKSVFARLGVWTAQKPQPKYHNGEFVFDEDALPLGTAFFVQIVQELLGPSAGH